MPKRKALPDSMTVSDVVTLTMVEPVKVRDGYLSRLRRLLRLRRDHFDELSTRGLKFLEHCIFSAYTDCIDIGLKAEADGLLKDVSRIPQMKSERKRRTGRVEILGASKQ